MVLVGENDQDPLKVNKPHSHKENKTTDYYIATINCRSLRTPEKLQELELSIEELKWDIIGISEMRKFGEGIEDHGKYILHYKGETPGLYGVGFMVKRNLLNNIEELRGISERIAILNIKLPINGEKEEKWTIIQAYSPTESDKNEDITKIEKFYNDLQSTIENAYKNIIVMGDFNGQIGKQKNGEEFTLGRYGIGNRSKNGTRLVNFALETRLSILNSFYKKKPSKKWTWISPNGLYKNEIDFIMSNNTKAFKDVSVINNLNFNTDHRMVRATLAGTRSKEKRPFHNKYSTIQYTGNTELLLNNLKTSLDNEFKNQESLQEKYNKLLNQIKIVTRKTNTNDKKGISLKIKELLGERKNLIRQEKKGKQND
ncbi:craniofacial development protein 2-like [Bicyclus anynana]|uniref:Craniofacial development protein 2-like n=1 Tax=Bicyclus anynana TaxID=110368 RepID=A0A6J1MNS3_BICAN|nr:craniofacial development protein 2-like [Bicyclus anynana]